MDRGERRGDFDHLELGPVVDVGVELTNVVKDIEHQSAIAGTNLVDDQVLIRGMGPFVVLHEVAGHSFAIVRMEEFGRGMPQLTSVVGPLSVEFVLEISISLTQHGIELMFTGHAVEIKRFTRREDDGLFRKVAIVWII